MGLMGFMYFLFISGVKMDLTLVKKSGRKHVVIAFLGVLAPILAVIGLSCIIRPLMDKELAKDSSIGAVAASVAIPAFPVLFPILKELNLLSSEVGRMALSTAIISDAIGLNAIAGFEAIKQGEAKSTYTIWYVISTIVLALFMVTVVRKFMIWIIERTPEGKPVDQSYVTIILLGVLVIGFLTDMFGIAIGNGPLWLGLVIPDGPPLGSTLVDKSETFIMEILMPFSFTYIGLYTDVYSMASIGWSGVAPLFYMVLIGYAFKFIATLLPSLFYNIPVRDSLTLSLIMSLRGQVEILLFLHWMDKKIIGIPRFSLMILLTMAVTAVATPLIAFFYDPTRPYMVNKRRTIQHTPPNTDIGIILCIHDQESVNGLINLLEISYPTTTSRFSVYAIHLVELLGRAAPVFVDHDKEEEDDRYCNAHTADDTIYSALKLYQEVRAEFVNIHAFTVQAPNRTMYQNICEMALLNKATIIIVPYHKEHLDGVTGIVRRGIQSVNSSVLVHAPCSVGVLVDKGELRQPIVGLRVRKVELNFVVLFLGGADSREALAYADRMVMNPDVTLTVIRFLSHNNEGDNEMEKKLDDGIVTSFWVKNEANDRVLYREVVVKNGEETVAAIQALNDGLYDLWIVGRQQGINPVLLEGLSNWSENIQELGVIGDIVAMADFASNGSVLVIQQ
ncbi:cation/H(+) antiporter 24 isoform X2 [Tripterygium wilfordii]|nr:cation/H(+) antiporter 24 isoform X2 [Tripterygium wilfordii]